MQRQKRRESYGGKLKAHEIEDAVNGRNKRLQILNVRLDLKRRKHKPGHDHSRPPLLDPSEYQTLMASSTSNEEVLRLLRVILAKLERREAEIYGNLVARGAILSENAFKLQAEDGLSRRDLAADFGLVWRPTDDADTEDQDRDKDGAEIEGCRSRADNHAEAEGNHAPLHAPLHERTKSHQQSLAADIYGLEPRRGGAEGGALPQGPYSEDALAAALDPNWRHLQASHGSGGGSGGGRVREAGEVVGGASVVGGRAGSEWLHDLAGRDEGLLIHQNLSSEVGLPGEMMAQLEAEDRQYCTPLLAAIRRGAVSACLALLMHGADAERCVSLPDRPSISPYGVASQRQDTCILTILATHAKVLARGGLGEPGGQAEAKELSDRAKRAAAGAQGHAASTRALMRKAGWDQDAEALRLQVCACFA